MIGHTSAACILLINEGKILAVCSPKNQMLCSLPGGKLTGFESTKTAAIREAYEETNIKVEACDWIHASQNGDYWTTTYLVSKWSGRIASSSEGVALWVSVDELLAGAWPEYNTLVLKKAGMLKQ